MKISKPAIIMICLSAVLLIVAAFPRTIELAAGNFLFGYDQGKHWLGAKAIVVDRKIPLIGDEVGGGGGFFQGAGWYWLQAVPYALFQGDPYGQLALMVASGLLTVLTAFWIYSQRFGKASGFVIAFLIAISPIMSVQSRFAWPPFIIPLCTVFFVDALYLVMLRKKFSWFYLFFVIALMSHFETATAATLGSATVIVLFLFRRASVRNIIEGCIGGLIPMIPLLIFDIRHGLLNVKGIYAMFFSVSSSGASVPFSKIFLTHLNIFSQNLWRTFPGAIPHAAFLFFLCMLSIAFFIDKKVQKDLKMFAGALYGVAIALFIVFLGYKQMLWDWWLLELPIMYCVIVGILLVFVSARIRFGRVIAGLFLLLLFRAYFMDTIGVWKNEYDNYGGTQKIRGRREAIEQIFTDAQGQPFGVLVFAPPIYTYPYDFLFWWIGTNKYHYVPHGEKKGLFYLLIEPDPEKPWTYKGWIETVIKEGNILFTKELPSGFIIEKRVSQ